jgi:hypothetical protein
MVAVARGRHSGETEREKMIRGVFMRKTAMTTKKSIIIILSVVAVIFVGLAGAYFWRHAKKMATATAPEALGTARTNALLPAPKDIRSLAGRVEAISGMTLTLGDVSVTPNPSAGNFPAIRIVTVTSSTRVTKLVLKDQAELQKETEAYYEEEAVRGGASSGQPMALPPMPVTETNTAFSYVKTGDIVLAFARGNILNATSFIASVIQDGGPSQAAPIRIGSPQATSTPPAP